MKQTKSALISIFFIKPVWQICAKSYPQNQERKIELIWYKTQPNCKIFFEISFVGTRDVKGRVPIGISRPRPESKIQNCEIFSGRVPSRSRLHLWSCDSWYLSINSFCHSSDSFQGCSLSGLFNSYGHLQPYNGGNCIH